MDQLARLTILRGEVSPVQYRVILYEVTSMKFIVHGIVLYKVRFNLGWGGAAMG